MNAALAVMASTLLLSAGKGRASGQAAPEHSPGPPTQVGEHLTPAFTEVSAYARLVTTSLATTGAPQAFLNAGERPLTVPDDHPSIGLPRRPPRHRVERSLIRVTSLDDPRLTARISDGWLIVSDAQGTRRVKASEFPDLTQ